MPHPTLPNPLKDSALDQKFLHAVCRAHALKMGLISAARDNPWDMAATDARFPAFAGLLSEIGDELYSLGPDSGLARLWMRTINKHLGAAPANLVESYEGLQRIHQLLGAGQPRPTRH